MTQESKLLLAAVRYAVTGSKVVFSLDVDWKCVLRLGNAHMLLPLMYDGLHRDSEVWAQVPREVQELLQKAFLRAVYQDTHMELLRNKLQQTLREAEIPHIILKGAVLKQNYPVPALRTMCDIDILVYAADFDRIRAAAQSLGGKALAGDGNHKSYRFPHGVLVEFHPNLLHHAVSVGCEINPGWQYADPENPNMLSEEGFYLNTLCHLANHFVAGGVGVRYVLDVWVNRHLRKPVLDRAFVEAELNRFGLLDFARNIEQLADAWFGDQPVSPVLKELGEYILTSSSHGIEERAVLNAVSLAPGGNRYGALWKKAFYPREELEDRFPWCKGKPLLLPMAWCVRAFRAVTRHRGVIVRWNTASAGFTRKQIREQREMLARFGICLKR